MAGEYAWTPDPETASRSNIGRFMKRHDIADYAELIRRSTVDVPWFWDAVVKDLEIEFFEPYTRVLDTSRGVPWARWFLGGRLNLTHNCLDRHARSPRSDRPAIAWEGEDGQTRRLSYKELDAETCRLANALRGLSLGVGDRIGLLMPMLPETVAAFLACAKIGAVAVPIFSGFGASAVAERLRDGEARLLITVDGFRRKGRLIDTQTVASEASKSCPVLEHILVLHHHGRNELVRPGFELWWHEAVAGQGTRAATESMDAEDPVLIVYTSGTSGRSKGSVHVHGGFLVKIAQEAAHQTDMTPDDVLFWVTDPGWIMGPWEVVGALTKGGTVFLYDGAVDFPSPDRLWSLVERHGVTILGVSPTLIRLLMTHGVVPVARHNLNSLRILGSTGEPWNPAPWLWFFEHVGGSRCPIINCSGGTEVGACFLSALPITPLKPCALVGPALGMDLDIFDSEGKPLRSGVGELVCKQPWPGMTRGLWRDPERYLQSYWSRWPDVWVHGDWASRDSDGDWFLHGRSDDTLNIAGKRIGPAEVESALIGHPAVVESAAVGVPDDLKGAVVWSYVVLHADVQPNDSLRDDLRGRVAAALGKSFAPARVLFVTELPKTRSAKVLRRAVRARALGLDAGDLSGLENPGALEAIDLAT